MLSERVACFHAESGAHQICELALHAAMQGQVLTVFASVESTYDDSNRALCISLTLSYSACFSFLFIAISSTSSCLTQKESHHEHEHTQLSPSIVKSSD